MKKQAFPFLIIILAFQFSLIWSHAKSQNNESENQSSFSFVFLTDIHLQPEHNAVEGFQKAINHINKLNPDFVITGGDLIMDALDVDYERADSLYKLYLATVRKFKMPVYNTMGNHEIFGIYRNTGSATSNPEYGERMYENRLGTSYYSFEHKGYKFMVLNSVEDTKKGSYIGLIDQKQMEWIKKDLEKTDIKIPIIISTHIPFITAYSQIYAGSTLPNDSSLVVANSYDVLQLFNKHNLMLILQGHLHTVEDIFINGTHFITGGAISGEWWKGANRGFEEGYMLIRVINEEIDWEYIDYGWEAEN